MNDPTIFDNLKVAFENYVYDLDNINGEVSVSNRKDKMEMASMSRAFSLQFTLAGQQDVTAEIFLAASLDDLAAEIMETSGENPGCTLLVRFYMEVNDVQTDCGLIEQLMQSIWDQRPLTQTISFVYSPDQNKFMNKIEVGFNRKINEGHIQDIPALIDHVLETLAQLNEMN
ncbi:hypothetical protein [Pseudalkalibacillus salsuginis]|uniref:hypothetical protein n=1 Tax=Pseudalkalibacillus salsuginis TaxID=2910972 RepID=UPI001F3E5B15|nr:hypothetical protein [Pseudalkalibacillus salsuginis]MCF6411363.1 hypothetical protein [Pseudalkalibacillus salsuginis]